MPAETRVECGRDRALAPQPLDASRGLLNLSGPLLVPKRGQNRSYLTAAEDGVRQET